MASTVSYEINREDARHQYDRRAHVTGTIKARERNQRQNDKARSIWFYPNSPDLEVAPKYTRHQEEYINPHLLEHERPIIAPRYGPNSVCKNFRPRPVKCRCDFCLSTAQTNENKRREAAIALNKVVGPVRAGVRKGAPFPDWDTSSFNCPHSYDGDIDWMRDYGDDKPAPPAQLDLMAMAKPAKKKKKKAASRQTPFHSKTRPPTLVSLADIDELSILDFEETWEHLDLDALDLSVLDLDDESRPRQPDEGSEWEWDRLSQI